MHENQEKCDQENSTFNWAVGLSKKKSQFQTWAVALGRLCVYWAEVFNSLLWANNLTSVQKEHQAQKGKTIILVNKQWKRKKKQRNILPHFTAHQDKNKNKHL